MSGGIGAVTGTGMDSQRNAVYVPDGDRRDGGTARHRHPGRVDDKAASITDLPVRVVIIAIITRGPSRGPRLKRCDPAVLQGHPA